MPKKKQGHIPPENLNKGSVLRFIATLPIHEADEARKQWTKYGRLSGYFKNKYFEFLVDDQEKTPQGGPAGRSTATGENYHV